MSLARVTCVRSTGPLSGEPFIDDYISTQEQVKEMDMCRIPTASGKPGKMREGFLVLGKSWNYAIVLKIMGKCRESWKTLSYFWRG